MNDFAISEIAATMRLMSSGLSGQSGNSSTTTEKVSSQGGGDFRQMLFEASISKITVNVTYKDSTGAETSFQGSKQTAQIKSLGPGQIQDQQTAKLTQKDDTESEKPGLVQLVKRDDTATDNSTAVMTGNTTNPKEVTTIEGGEGLDYLDELEDMDRIELLQGIMNGTIQLPQLDDETMETIEDAVDDLIFDLAVVMDVYVDDIEEALDDLGMTGVDLYDPKNLATLLVEVEDEDDVSVLLTDSDLQEEYMACKQALTDMREEITETLDIDEDDLDIVLLQYKMQEKPETLDLTEESDTEADSYRTITKADNTAERLIRLFTGETDDMNVDMDTDTDSNVLVTNVAQTEEEPTQDQNTGNSFGSNGEGLSRKNSERAVTSGLDNMMDLMDRMTQNVESVFNQFMDSMTQSVQGTTEAELTAQEARVQAQNIVDQVVDFMKVNIKPDVSSLELQLHPQNLGNVNIQIATSGDGNTVAKFVTQNETVKAAIEGELAQLIQRFDEQNVKVNAIEVTVEPKAFEQNLEQGQHNSQSNEEGYKPGSGSTRNLNLDDLDMGDPTLALSEAERIMAEMMAASGATVNYSA